MLDAIIAEPIENLKHVIMNTTCPFIEVSYGGHICIYIYIYIYIYMYVCMCVCVWNKTQLKNWF